MKFLTVIFLPFLLVSIGIKAEYYSQSGQDQWLNETIFFNKTGGVFIDIGAHDGISYSNSYFFEKERSWTGVCIEPMPDVFQLLKNNRKCKCIQACISDIEETADFLRIINKENKEIEMFSGLIKKYCEPHRYTLEHSVFPESGGHFIIRVQCLLLNNILRESGFVHIDYLSIDTEGGELDILKSIDFNCFSIDVISVENNYYGIEIKDFLESKGYQFIARVGYDEIYRSRKYVA